MQDQQQEMLRAAERLPGVADVAEVYGAIEPYVQNTVVALSYTSSFASGGNVEATQR